MTKALSGGQRKYPLFLCPSTIRKVPCFFSSFLAFLGGDGVQGKKRKGYLTLSLIYMKNNKPFFWLSPCVPRKSVLKQH